LTGTRNLHRFALFTTCCTFVLLVAGGLVTSTGSGLSVPDWPETYGHFMFAFPLDQMVGGIFFEHSHRLIASFVGFLTVILAIWLWRREERAWVRNLGFVALGSVILQGVLGGLTVRFLLPTWISATHATLAQTFFCLVIAISLFTSRWWSSVRPADDVHAGPLFRLFLFAVLAVFVQLMLGAVMRHMDAGLAVPDVPLAYGQLIPDLSPQALQDYTRELQRLDIRIAADGPLERSQVLIHLLHRLGAMLTATAVVLAAIFLLRSRGISRSTRRTGYFLIALLLIQITLGLLTVLSRKAVDVTTAHVATGALLLGMTVLTLLRIGRETRVVLSTAAVREVAA
jgi:cytochrome c oxidase assembly protein subunit 15